ncbi:hypothetical protein J7426_08325 [Tropicibacter sp. R16_0]|uniref:hypothetical protein n=1 Tax=Tropicibacter sp. R16_0 TaxID=2821102 RepID=UPI001ADBC786|nr:hypothetical protein [Tropicibacter sp. R16_0]MBO9450255.1 hypothetical protein [Tropicibacter sp. R16_0]
MKTTRLALLGVLCAAVAVAGCNRKKNAANLITYDGIEFRTEAQPVDKKATLADFYVRVEGAAISVDSARKAARDRAYRYCIENYGTSDIDWAVGPDADPAQLQLVDGALTFRGTCGRP